MTQAAVKWGILAPGNIAGTFVPDAQGVAGSEVLAAGSRDLARAQAFARRHGIERSYGSYEELVDDPDVNVVYVSSPHNFHYEHAKLALEHGKGALVEKPFAINSREAIELVELARAKGLFLMEALWTRCHPNILHMGQLVRDGAIGEVRSVSASLAPIGVPSGFRGFRPELGGGALLECGVYPLNFAFHMLRHLGEPVEVKAWSTFTDLNVDDSTSFVLRYRTGAVASLTTSLVPDVDSGLPSRAYISGSTGWIDVPRDIFNPREFTVHRQGKPAERFEVPPVDSGYGWEVAEVVKSIRKGATESTLIPLDETLLLVRLLDQVREIVGLRYPYE